MGPIPITRSKSDRNVHKMTVTNQKDQIVSSLKSVVRIFQDCGANYRIIGSILLVAHTGNIFRTIHDIDILLDKKDKNNVFKQLKENGFTLVEQNKVGFHYIEANKEGLLTLTFMLIGDFTQRYFSWHFSGTFELRIRNNYLKSTKYRFERIEFVGIPISSAIAGIKMSFLNPKRKLDREVLGQEFSQYDVNLYDNIVVYFMGIKLPFLYDVFSFLYNIYGGLRVILGKRYEIWD